MKNLFYSALFFSFSVTLFAQEPEREYDYMFFENSVLSGNYFYSSVDYSEGSYVKSSKGKLPVCEGEFFTPPNALELNYTNGNGTWEAGISFEQIRGNNFFKKSDHLSFWMFAGNTTDDLLPQLALSHQEKKRRSDIVISDERSKLISIKKHITNIEKQGWKFVKITLKDFGDFEGRPNNVVFSNSSIEGEGKILIDQVELFPEVVQASVPTPKNISAEGFELHVDVSWEAVENTNLKYIKIYRSEDTKNFKPVGIQRPFFNRFTDFTGETDKAYYYKISYLDYQYNETELSESTNANTRSFVYSRHFFASPGFIPPKVNAERIAQFKG